MSIGEMTSRLSEMRMIYERRRRRPGDSDFAGGPSVISFFESSEV